MKKNVKNFNWPKRIIALLLTAVMLVGYLPSISAQAADGDTMVADPSTAMSYEQMLGTSIDGNRYAGRIWTDKSVFAADSVTLDGFTVTNNSEDKANEFMTVFSALGSTTSVYTETTVSSALDVVLILDISRSMETTTTVNGQRVSRLEAVANAANGLLASILDGDNNRLAIVTYSSDGNVLVPLNYYQSSDSVLSVSGTTTTATVTPVGSSQSVRYSRSTSSGTNLQAGINTGMGLLANATNVSGRTPVVIVMTDGQANRAVNRLWYNVASSNVSSSNNLTAGIALSTLLNAAYMKSLIEQNYSADGTATEAVVYGIGVDLEGDDTAAVVMDPVNAFGAQAPTNVGRTAYSWYQTWEGSNNAVTQSGFSFDQLPTDGSVSVTKNQVKENINYTDKYFPVSSAGEAGSELEAAFDEIVESLTQAAWNPITDSVIQGGIDYATPLTYVDFIGDYMEVKDIKALTIFGNKYEIGDPVSTSAATYSVVDGKIIETTVATYKASGNVVNSILNPNTQISLNDAITITVTTETPVTEVVSAQGATSYVQSGAAEQTLRVVLNNDRVLPLINEEVDNQDGTITITETSNTPLRVYYTVGVTDYILDSAGNVIMDLVDESYKTAHTDANGKLWFYTNQYFEMNAGQTVRGDAHASAQPSEQNRYYYHQNNYPIYTSVTTASGGNVTWDEGEYGVLYYSSSGLDSSADANRDNLADYKTTVMTYASVPSNDNQQVYTLVGFHRPTASTNDAANTGEVVTYIVYTTWGQLKQDTALYDSVNGVYINYDEVTKTCYTSDTGYVVDLSDTYQTTAVNAYIVAKGITAANVQVYLGIGSWRQSRMDNMTRSKSENKTGTAETSVIPALNTDAAHVGGLVMWLGNNGKITRSAATGLKITKNVTEYAEGHDENKSFTINVSVPGAVGPVSVVNEQGVPILSGSFMPDANGVLTGSVYLKAGESVYLTYGSLTEGTPATYVVTENESGYTYTVETTSGDGTLSLGEIEEVTVTNDAIGYGDLLITKEVANSLGGSYGFPTTETFNISVQLSGNVAADSFKVYRTEGNNRVELVLNTDYAYNANTISNLTIKHGQTIKISGLPEGTTATVIEKNVSEEGIINSTNGSYKVSYTSRDYTNATLDDDAQVTINKNLESTVVVKNTYTPDPININVGVDVSKTYNTTETLPEGGETFAFQLKQYDDIDGWTQVGDNGTITVTNANTLTNPDGNMFTVTIDDVAEPGQYNYRVVEVDGGKEGITYDETIHSFSIDVTYDSVNNKLVYNVVGTDANDDGSIDAHFTNTYATASAAIIMQKTVTNNSGDPAKDTAAGFKFSLYETDGTWDTINVTPSDQITSGRGTADWFLTYNKTDAGYDEESAATSFTKEHYYVLKENMGADGAGWDYDESEYHITVEVTYTPAGEGVAESLSAIITKIEKKIGDSVTDVDLTAEKPITFTNIYTPTKAEITDLNTIPTVLKAMVGKSLAELEGDFTFQIADNHEFTDSDDGTKNILATGTNGADGKVTFNNNLEFTKIGTYHYYVREVVPAGAVDNVLNGITYDTSIYDMIVVVTDNCGELVADYYFEDATTKTVTFTNRYAVTEPATLKLSGTKTLDGRNINDGEFSFKMTAYEVVPGTDAGTTVDQFIREQVVTNVGSSVAFPEITFTAANIGNTYKYVITEVAGNLGGVTYDTNMYTVVVEVVDDGVGGVQLNITGNPAALNFNNTYSAAPTSVSLTGTKNLIGRTQNAGEFTYTVMEGNVTVGTGTNTAGGEIVFDFDSATDGNQNLYYTSAGPHTYTITEDKAGTTENGVTYDDTVYTMTVNVTDNGRGNLVAEQRINGALGNSVSFTNHYEAASVTIDIDGTKKLNNVAPAAGRFSFGLYNAVQNTTTGKYEIAKDDDGNISEPIQIAENDADGNFKFVDGVFVAEGDYYYIVQEILPEGYTGEAVNGVTYDTTQYLVKIHIGHNQQLGQLTYNKTQDLTITPIYGTSTANGPH